MASLFRSLWKDARSNFDGMLGEAIEFRPQEPSELIVVGADDERPVRTLIGIFQDDATISRPVGSGANTHETVDITVTRTQVDFDEDLFPTLADRPKDGDILALVERDGAPLFQIESVEPDHLAKVVCIVTPLGPY